MLVLTRRVDESIAIGDNIQVTVLGVEGDRVKLGISAPRDIVILRQEIFQAIQEQKEIQAQLLEKPDAQGFDKLREFLAEAAEEEEPAESEPTPTDSEKE